jgi:hypothetical protein
MLTKKPQIDPRVRDRRSVVTLTRNRRVQVELVAMLTSRPCAFGKVS